MQGVTRVCAIFAATLLGSAAFAQEDSGVNGVIVSIADQKLMVVRDGMWVEKFPVSTSKFGEGDAYGSYKTPLGRLRVCSKIGDGLPVGAVMQHRNATGEILPVNARGRDPIVTRIIWLEGLESGNERARARGIYIHGTVEEAKIGKPASYGCIRMRSQDVVQVFDLLPVGTPVLIQQDKLPRLRKWSAPPPQPVLVMKEKEQPKVEAKADPKLVAKNEAKIPAKGEKEPVKVAANTAAKPAAVAEKSEPRVFAGKTARETSRPLTLASAEPAASKSIVIIRSSGWAEDAKPVPADALPTVTLKESILFADLPGHGLHRSN
jgi:hypothetical protein